MSQGNRRQPPRRQHDDVWVQIAPARGADTSTIRAVVQRPGGFAFGMFADDRSRLPDASDIRRLQRDYEQRVRDYQEDLALGRPAAPPEPDDIRALGRRVAAVLPPAAQREIALAVFHARSRRRGLRITLELSPELQDLLPLPWELLTLPLTRADQTEGDAATTLLRTADIVLVRQVRGVGSHQRLRLTRPLTVQAFAASPRDGTPVEFAATQAALNDIAEDAPDQHWYGDTSTLTAMEQRLRLYGPQIVHLLCHGKRHATPLGRRSDLLLVRSDGREHRVSAFDLAPVLSLAPDLQMVVLQACHSAIDAPATDATREEREAIESIALSLLRHGVPLVIAMQGAVMQDAAGAFARQLYTQLQQGASFESAVGIARVAMIQPGGALDWSLPVVYQGSGRPEPDVWHARMAARVEARIFDRAVMRTARAIAGAVAVILLASAVFRWILMPGVAAEAGALVGPLAVWSGVGLTVPGLIALLVGGPYRGHALQARAHTMARASQWVGAYLAFALTGLAGLTLIAGLWSAGALGLMPPGSGSALLALVIGASLGMSYVGARSQARTAEVLGVVDPSLFAPKSLALVLAGATLLIGSPLLLLLLPATPLAFLLSPAPAALALSLALSSLIVALR